MMAIVLVTGGMYTQLGFLEALAYDRRNNHQSSTIYVQFDSQSLSAVNQSKQNIAYNQCS